MFLRQFKTSNLRILFILPRISLLKSHFYGNFISRIQALPSESDSYTIPFQSSTPPFYGELNHCASKSNQIIAFNKMITSYINRGDLDSAMKVFLRMEMRTTVTWNSILAGFLKRPGMLNEAQQLFDEIPVPDTVSYNIMLACYLKNSDVEEAKGFFNRMLVKDIASWNTMISGLSQHGSMNEANELFSAMPKRNLVTWNAMISGYVETGDLEAALELFGKAPVKGVIAWNAIITGYMRSGRVELAEKVFCETPDKNPVTWNAMMAGYVENGRGEDCLKVLKKMLESRIQADPSGLCTILLACSNLSVLKFGKQVHQLMQKSPLYLDAKVGNALISMYCKCGVLKDAWKLFQEMACKDLVTWNAMISGYAQHGVSGKALSLFDEMRNAGIKPDWITFVGVLSACNHTGLVDAGVCYFEKMQKDYEIAARPDHYTSMIDLLGRAGRLTEAVDLIKKMPFKPHSAIYGTLLGACRIHKNLEIAEFAANNLLSLDLGNPAAYVQLANVYAAKNNWESVSKVRRWMKENKVMKTPGYSWIEVKSVVHEFRSGDRLHPELECINKKLAELEKKMKLAGYVPDLEYALRDVGEEQKEQLLLWHSEKLATAFGLIRLPPGVPIRVFKNLRVCGDCHEATKFISAIESRRSLLEIQQDFTIFLMENARAMIIGKPETTVH